MSDTEPEDDATHFDGVYIGPRVPVSVFYKGVRDTQVVICRTPRQMADQVAAAEIRKGQEQRDVYNARAREKRRINGQPTRSIV